MAAPPERADQPDVEPSQDSSGQQAVGEVKAAPRRVVSWVATHVNVIAAYATIIGVVIAAIALIPPFRDMFADSGRSASTTTPPATPSEGDSPVTLTPTTDQLVSSTPEGIPANGDSGRPSLDSTGRYVVFTSNATNLADAATSGRYNIYRKDRLTGAVHLASGGRGRGEVGNGDSQFPTVCSNGRFVSFASTSTNLLAEGPRLRPGPFRVYVRDTLNQTTYLISPSDADGDSVAPQLSEDCSKIVFESDASNLVRGDDNGSFDVFVTRVGLPGSTTLVSSNARGLAANASSSRAAISPDGRFVAFTSWATDVVEVSGRSGRPEIYVHDLPAARSSLITGVFGGQDDDIQGFSWPNFSGDSKLLVFRSLTRSDDPSPRGRHVYVWDVERGRSVITEIDGTTPTGWADACTTGVSNGTNFSPQISGAATGRGYLVLFTIPDGTSCGLVLRDLDGNDIPVDIESSTQEVIEPSLSSTGTSLAWAVTGNSQAGTPQLVYSCDLSSCR